MLSPLHLTPLMEKDAENEDDGKKKQTGSEMLLQAVSQQI